MKPNKRTRLPLIAALLAIVASPVVLETSCRPTVRTAEGVTKKQFDEAKSEAAYSITHITVVTRGSWHSNTYYADAYEPCGGCCIRFTNKADGREIFLAGGVIIIEGKTNAGKEHGATQCIQAG